MQISTKGSAVYRQKEFICISKGKETIVAFEGGSLELGPDDMLIILR